jgi:hypothetical protein
MAQVDPNIALSIRPVQIPLEESPLNRMQRFAEFENALVKSQEAQRQAAQRNALARIYAKPGLEVGSPEYFKLIQSEVPDYYETAVDKQLKREQLREAKQTSDLRQKELEAKNLDRDLVEFNQVYSPALIRNVEQAKARTKALYAHPTLGARAARLMPEADALLRTEQEFTNNYEGYIASQYGMTGKDILEAENRRKKDLRESAEKAYPAYQLSEYEAGREPLPLDAYVARRTQTTAPASTFAPAVASEPEMVGGDGEMVTLPDGTRQTPAVTKTEKKPISAFGQDVHPLVPSLLAGGNKEMATIVQEGHRATGTLRQINDTFDTIDRLEREKPKGYEARIIALRNHIKTISTEGPGTKVQVGVRLPEGVKAVDQKYAQDYLDWSQGGGADAAANMGQIKSVLDRFAAGERLSGPSIGLAPDFFNALMNPQALGAKQQVEEVVQRNLRAVLGAQFTQVEGERLISRAFDARLSPQENVKRLRKLFMQMQTAAQQKQAMAEYYEANETLRGYKGKQPKMQDFFDVLSTPDAPPKGSVDVKGPDGKMYRFPDKSSADKFKKDNGIKD